MMLITGYMCLSVCLLYDVIIYTICTKDDNKESLLHQTILQNIIPCCLSLSDDQLLPEMSHIQCSTLQSMVMPQTLPQTITLKINWWVLLSTVMPFSAVSPTNSTMVMPIDQHYCL